MAYYSLGDRQKGYELASDFCLMRRVPVIIRVDGRSFSKATRRLTRPYCPRMIELMSTTMLLAAKQIDGATFAYQQSDEITFVLRNDQSLDTIPWFGNRVQKIASITAGLCTYIFNEELWTMDDPPELMGPTLFDARAFTVPSAGEAINNLVFRQQDCSRNALTAAAYAALGKKFGKKTAYRMLHGKGHEERAGLLLDECGIDFERDYPVAFKHGVAAYRTPHLVDTEQGKVTRHKWIVDLDFPKITENRDFVEGIIDTGSDVLRPERDLENRPLLSHDDGTE